MDGIFYVINQLGLALSQANSRIAQLERELVAVKLASKPESQSND